MTIADLELRVAELERTVAFLSASVGGASGVVPQQASAGEGSKRPDPISKQGWVAHVSGAFAGDAGFDEIARLGEQYREAQNGADDPQVGE